MKKNKNKANIPNIKSKTVQQQFVFTGFLGMPLTAGNSLTSPRILLYDLPFAYLVPLEVRKKSDFYLNYTHEKKRFQQSKHPGSYRYLRSRLGLPIFSKKELQDVFDKNNLKFVKLQFSSTSFFFRLSKDEKMWLDLIMNNGFLYIS